MGSVDQGAHTGSGHQRTLIIGALGIVYGDIGTSPIYALRESIAATAGLTGTENAVLGVLSLMFWSLVIVVTIKYVLLIMRADNRGEGGVLSLAALALRAGDQQAGAGLRRRPLDHRASPCSTATA